MDIVVRFLSPGLMVVLGLWAGAFFVRRFRSEWRVVWLGALTFVGAQVLHIPFNSYVLNPLLGRLGWAAGAGPGTLALVWVGLAFGLSAGLFEELGRYVVYRLGLKGVERWGDGLAFGAGHGGMEAVLLGGLGVLTVIQIISLDGMDLAQVVPPEQLPVAQMQIEAFWAAPWYMIGLGFVERIFAICFHLSASLLVLQAVRRKSVVWLVAAIGWHTLLDAAAVYGASSWGAVATEGVLGVFALVSLWVVARLRDGPAPEDSNQMPRVPEKTLDLSRVDVTDEQLEESRYG